MNNERYINLLLRLHACDPAIDHIRTTGLSLAEAWEASEQGDHMAWLLAHLLDRQRLALVLADVVEPTLAYDPPKENRPRKCVEALRKFARGEITQDELVAYGNSAWHAEEVVWSSSLATSSAAWTVSWDAAWAAARATKAAGNFSSAPIIRRHVGATEIVALAEAYAAKHNV